MNTDELKNILHIYAQTPINIQLKVILACKIDEFISLFSNAQHRIIGYGSFFQSRYIDGKLSRVLWDFSSDIDLKIVSEKDNAIAGIKYIMDNFRIWSGPY